MWPNLAMLWEILVDIYGCMVALLRKSQGQVEALLADRTRLEVFVKIQHEFWVARVSLLQAQLQQVRYELLKRNHLRGLKVNFVRAFSKQILDAMIVMRDAGIIHCDPKPENILLAPSVTIAAAVKVIDFGSACMEGKTVYSYIQSHYYRSPEVLLGYPC